MTNEEWKPVVGYEGLYEVSDCGKVKNVKERMNTYVGRIFKGGSTPDGYRIVLLSNNGYKKAKTVHSIVAEAFIGERPVGMVINHKDGNKINNTQINLEYVTVKENAEHANRTGLLKPNFGEENGKSKLTISDVLTIRELYEAKEKSQKELSVKYGVSVMAISRIVNRETWAHLK